MRPALALAFLLCMAGCQQSPDVTRMSGPIFGTQWHLTYHGAGTVVDEQVVTQLIQDAFAVVDGSMNHYQPDSMLSRLNAAEAQTAMEVDWDFALVFNTALDIYYATDGAYDPSVSPLINLWGFGPKGPTRRPSGNQLEETQKFVGLNAFAWDLSSRTFVKRDAMAMLDFSSIAKGYAVDLGADALAELGIANFMLEVGGEVQVRGKSPRGDQWRLAIEEPVPGVGGKIFTAISVSDVGIATSGDYRNFFESEGRRYSHLIDPRTGFPIEHDLVSATVIHPSTMLADAWATALMVVGTKEALRLANTYDLAVYLISRQGDELISSYNDDMMPWLLASENGEGQ